MNAPNQRSRPTIPTTAEPQPSRLSRILRAGPRRRALFLALVLAFVVTPVVAAATIADGETYVLAAGETVDGNLYAFANSVRIDGTVTGDLVSAGSIITIGSDGRIEGDLWAAGSEVHVEGEVSGDLRGAGYQVEVANGGSVGGEMMAAGFSVEIDEGAGVDGEARIAGYQALLNGEMGDNVWVSSGALEVTGRIAGDLNAEVDTSGEGGPPSMAIPGQPRLERNLKPGLVISEDAEIEGDLIYDKLEDVDVAIPAESVQGEVTAQIRETLVGGVSKPKQSPFLTYGLDVLKRFVALLVVGFLALWGAPRLLAGTADRIGSETAGSSLWGFLGHAGAAFGFFLLIPVTILLFVLLSALQLGGVLAWLVASASALTGASLLFGFTVLRWLARIAFALWLGRMLLSRSGGDTAPSAWLAVGVGALLYAVAAELPWGVGFFVDLLFVIVAVGALLRTWFRANSRPSGFGDPLGADTYAAAGGD